MRRIKKQIHTDKLPIRRKVFFVQMGNINGNNWLCWYSNNLNQDRKLKKEMKLLNKQIQTGEIICI